MDFEKMIAVTNANNHFMRHNGMKLTELWTDHAVVELTVSPESYNLFGGVHGGAYFTLADCAAGSVARTNGMIHVTLNSSFEFYKAAKGKHIRAIANVRQRGNTVCVISVEVQEEEGTLLAEGVFTYFSTGKMES